MANDELEEETEEYVYDAISLISEVGGSLGLFLGFSFFMLYDLILSAFKEIKKNINKWSYVMFVM